MNQSPTPEQEIQPADPAARKRALWIVFASLALVLVLALVAYGKEDPVEKWLSENTEAIASSPGIVFIVTFILMTPIIGGAIHTYRLAGRIVQSQRIPPPGQKVIKDTPVITGRKAVRQGRGLKLMAALMGLFGLLLPFGLTLILMMLNKSI